MYKTQDVDVDSNFRNQLFADSEGVIRKYLPGVANFRFVSVSRTLGQRGVSTVKGKPGTVKHLRWSRHLGLCVMSIITNQVYYRIPS